MWINYFFFPCVYDPFLTSFLTFGWIDPTVSRMMGSWRTSKEAVVAILIHVSRIYLAGMMNISNDFSH
jgi:hypothetical protein